MYWSASCQGKTGHIGRCHWGKLNEKTLHGGVGRVEGNERDGRVTSSGGPVQEVGTTAGYKREERVLLEFGAVEAGLPDRCRNPKPRAQLLLARNRGVNTPTTLFPPSRRVPAFWLE